MAKQNLKSCDGGHLTINTVKVLPISEGSGNLIVCRQCFLDELKGRFQKGKEKYDFPKWDELNEHKPE